MKAIKAFLAGLTVFALFGVGIASAAVTQTNLLVNGDVHGTAPSGDVVNLSVQFTNTGVSTFQSAWVEIPGSGFPGECIDVLDNNQIGTHTVNFNVNTLGTTEGDWTVNVHPYGINRVTTGSQPTDTDCTNSSGSNKPYPNQLKITNPIATGPTSNNTGNGGVNGSGNQGGGTGVNNGNAGNSNGTGNSGNGGSNASTTPPLWFTQWLAQWEANHPSTPASDSLCVAFKSKLLASTPGQRTGANAVLQGFLTGAGETIAPYSNNTSIGFFGPITAAAVAHFQLVHNCQ